MNRRRASGAAFVGALFFLGACASTKPDLPDDPSAGLDFPRKKEGSGGEEGSGHSPEGSGSSEDPPFAAPPTHDLAGTDDPPDSEPSPAEGGGPSAPEPTEAPSAPTEAEPSAGSHATEEAENPEPPQAPGTSPSAPTAPPPDSSPAGNDSPDGANPASPPPPPAEEAQPPENVPPGAANEGVPAEPPPSEPNTPSTPGEPDHLPSPGHAIGLTAPSTSGEPDATPPPNHLGLTEPDSAQPATSGSDAAIGLTEPPTSGEPNPSTPPNHLGSSDPGSTSTPATGESSPSLGLTEPATSPNPSPGTGAAIGLTEPPASGEAGSPAETSSLGFTDPETNLFPPESSRSPSLGFADPLQARNSLASGGAGRSLGFSEPSPQATEPTRRPARFLSLRELLNRRTHDEEPPLRSRIGWSDPDEPRLQSYVDDGPIVGARPAAPREYDALSGLFLPRDAGPARRSSAAVYDYDDVREALSRSAPLHPFAMDPTADPIDYQDALRWLDKRNNPTPLREAAPKPQRSYKATLRWLRSKGRD